MGYTSPIGSLSVPPPLLPYVHPQPFLTTSTLQMDAESSSDMFLPICHRTCHHIPQDSYLQETFNLFKLVLQLQKYKNEQTVVLNRYS